MFWILLIAIPITGFLWLGIREDEWGLGVLFGILSGLMTFLVGLVVSAIIFAVAPTTQTELPQSTPLIALQDNTSIHGRSYLGSGRADEDLYYYYLYKTDMGVTQGKVKADEAYIRYTKDNTPRVHPIEQTFTTWFPKFWFFDKDYEEGYIIYLPEDSIITEYQIDLK